MKTLEQLFAEVLDSEELKNAFAEAAKDGKVVEFAAAHGVQATEEEIAAFLKARQQKTGELSEDELDNVSGGCNKDEILLSVGSFGVGCAVQATVSALAGDMKGNQGQILCDR